MAPSVIAISQDVPVRLSVIVSVLLPMAILQCPSSCRTQCSRQRRDGRSLDPPVLTHRHTHHFAIGAALEHHRGLLDEAAVEVDRIARPRPNGARGTSASSGYRLPNSSSWATVRA